MKLLRATLLIALTLALASGALAGEPEAHPMMGGSPEEHEAMMEDMRARQERLDELVAAMERARGPEKVDAVAAVVKELVAQRGATTDRMQQMHERMMESMHGEARETAPSQPGHEGHQGAHP